MLDFFYILVGHVVGFVHDMIDRIEVQLVGYELVVSAGIEHGRLGRERAHAVHQVGEPDYAEQIEYRRKYIRDARKLIYDGIAESVTADAYHDGHAVQLGVVLRRIGEYVLDVVAYALIVAVVVAEQRYERAVGEPRFVEVIEHDAYRFVKVHACGEVIAHRIGMFVVGKRHHAELVHYRIVRFERFAVGVLTVLSYRRDVGIERLVGGEHARFACFHHLRVEVAFAETGIVVVDAHILDGGEGLEPERVGMVLNAVIERFITVVEGVALNAVQRVEYVGQAVRDRIGRVRIVDVFVERVVADYRFVFGNIRFFERVRVIEYDRRVVLVEPVKVGIHLAQCGDERIRVELGDFALVFEQHARVAVRVAFRVVEEREPLEALAEHRYDVIYALLVARFAEIRGLHGLVLVDEVVELVEVVDLDIGEPKTAYQFVIEVADEPLIGISARFGLVQLVAEVVGLRLAVGNAGDKDVRAERAGEQDGRRYHRRALSVGYGHGLFEQVSERAVQRDDRRRYEYVSKADGDAFDDGHCVAAQVEHGEVEYRARAVEYDDKHHVEHEVADECGYEQDIARGVPGQVERNETNERDQRQVQPRLGHVELARGNGDARQLEQDDGDDVADHEVVFPGEVLNERAYGSESFF